MEKMKKQDLEYKYKSALETLSQEWIEKFFDEWKLKLKKEMIFDFLQDLSELENEKVDVDNIIEVIMKEYIDIENAVCTNDTFVDEIRMLLNKHLKASSDIDKQVDVECKHWYAFDIDDWMTCVKCWKKMGE